MAAARPIKDSTLAAASTAAGKPIKLIVYPDADHDFVKGEDHYNPKDYADAFKRTADRLKVYLGFPFDSNGKPQ